MECEQARTSGSVNTDSESRMIRFMYAGPYSLA